MLTMREHNAETAPEPACLRASEGRVFFETGTFRNALKESIIFWGPSVNLTC